MGQQGNAPYVYLMGFTYYPQTKAVSPVLADIYLAVSVVTIFTAYHVISAWLSVAVVLIDYLHRSQQL